MDYKTRINFIKQFVLNRAEGFKYKMNIRETVEEAVEAWNLIEKEWVNTKPQDNE